MRKILSYSFVTLFVFLSFLPVKKAQAANIWVNDTTIEYVAAWSGGMVVLMVPPGVLDPICGSGIVLYIRVGFNGVTAEDLDRLLSVAMTARTTNATVSFYYDNASANCYVTSIAY